MLAYSNGRPGRLRNVPLHYPPQRRWLERGRQQQPWLQTAAVKQSWQSCGSEHCGFTPSGMTSPLLHNEAANYNDVPSQLKDSAG